MSAPHTPHLDPLDAGSSVSAALLFGQDPTETDGGVPTNTLVRELYDDLRCLAKWHRSQWTGNHTIDATALVHEAYLKVIGADRFDCPAHFLAVASRAMRHALVNYAEARVAQKRGGGAYHISLEDAPPDALFSDSQVLDVLTLDSALLRLEQLDPRAAQVVEARFFSGLTLDETAEALGVSEATVTRDWRRARAWLRGELTEAPRSAALAPAA